MLIAAHAISAGVVGEMIGNPFLAFLVGIIIHFVLDSIPHYDTTDKGAFTKRQLILAGSDALIAIFIFVHFFRDQLSLNSPFVWGAFGGIFPDFLDVNPFWAKSFRKTRFGRRFHKFHDKIQFYKLSPVPGILVQVVIIFISIFLSVRYL